MLSPLPIDAQLGEITEAMRTHRNLILTATPGAGKTTRLPPSLLKAVSGKIAILEPRRMATVAACQRVAEEQGWEVGREVGYQVRFESKVTAATRLVFMTDALMLRKMIDDPELREFSLVVIDEFHERNLNQDLILGAVRELQELGSPIKLMIMSATLDVAALCAFLPESFHVEVPGKVFPLEIRHSTQNLSLRTDRAFYDRVGEAVRQAVRETAGDVLVFLPGTGEIARTAEGLGGISREIVPLHGSLSLNEQRAVLRPPSVPRVVLATNVAEASVTVQGVDFVIDTGIAKIMEVNAGSGFSALELKRISQFNARQRAGRAARQRAGVCLRLWTPHEEVTQAQEMPPECQRADLTSALLWLAHLGVADFAGFAWLDRPPDVYLNLALRSLLTFGALDANRRLTELGRRLIRFPLPPRWGALLAQAEHRGLGAVGARAAALLAERDFADRGGTAPTECDVIYRLSLLEDFARGGRGEGRAVREILEASRQLERTLSRPGDRDPEDIEVRRLLLHSQRDRLCRRRGKSDRALMTGGRGVRLSPDSQVRESEFFVALNGVDLPGQNETLISLASGFPKAFVLDELLAHIVSEDRIDFNEAKGEFQAKRLRTIAGLPIEEPTLTAVDPSLVSERLGEILLAKFAYLVKESERLGAWWSRWNFFLRHRPEAGVDPELLPQAKLAESLAMAAFGKTKMSEVLTTDLVSFIEMAIAPENLREFHQQVPDKFTAPSGVSHRIEYTADAAYVEVRLQEIFGLTQTPLLVHGKVPLVFRLLAPNYRPVQVTGDLAGFWRGAYLEVRKELRARYPKHSWPDDPLTAKPEAKGRRRF